MYLLEVIEVRTLVKLYEDGRMENYSIQNCFSVRFLSVRLFLTPSAFFSLPFLSIAQKTKEFSPEQTVCQSMQLEKCIFVCLMRARTSVNKRITFSSLLLQKRFSIFSSSFVRLSFLFSLQFHCKCRRSYFISSELVHFSKVTK